MTVLRMDNVGVVVTDLAATVEFFEALGMEREGTATVDGADVDRIVGLTGVRCDIAMMCTPDGHNRLELMSFHNPPSAPTDETAPVHALGLRRLLFAVEDLEGTVTRLKSHGAEPVGEVTDFGGFRWSYLRGPDGIIVALAEQLS